MAISIGTGELLALTRMGRGCCLKGPPQRMMSLSVHSAGCRGQFREGDTQPWSRSHICPYPYLVQVTLPSKQLSEAQGSTPLSGDEGQGQDDHVL